MACKACKRPVTAVPAQRQHATPEDIYMAAIDRASADFQDGVARVTAGLAGEWHRKISAAAARLAEATTEEAA